MTNLTANPSDLFGEAHDEVYAVLVNACRPLTCGEVSDGVAGAGVSYAEARQSLKDLSAAGKVKVKPGKVLRYTTR